jgi:hypothetical protein
MIYSCVLIRFSWVQTDQGNGVAKAQGLEKAPITVEYSVEFILGKVRQLSGLVFSKLTFRID